MADLRETIAAFRRNWFITDEGKFVDLENEALYFKNDLLALIAEMKKNPPTQGYPQQSVGYGFILGVWQQFADLLTEALSPEEEKR